MKTLRAITNILKKCFPEYEIHVRRVVVPRDIDGDCRLVDNRKKRPEFLIRIDRNIDEETAVQVLLHEISHCVAWHEPGSDHGPAWGRAFARVYRIYLKEWIQKND